MLEPRAMLAATITPHQLLPVPTANVGILLLDHTAVDSLTRTGNGGIFVTNADIVIDSSNKAAGLVTGNGNVVANDIFVTGGLKHTGKGRFEGNIVTGVTPTPDPLAALPAPIPTAPFFGAQYIGNHSTVTLSPGTYTGGIFISGHASVTLLPGTYIIQGGGFSVSGNASLTGDGVTIYNGPSTTPSQKVGPIVFSGHADVTLSAPGAGEFQGIVIFQARTASTPITISASGANLTGTVYAANALLNISGNGNVFINGLADETILASVIVKDLLDSGNTNLFVNGIASGVETDLAITKEDDVGGSSVTSTTGAILAGNTITYTITVTNNGPSNAVGASVTDAFPAEITSDTFTAVESGGATGFTASGSGNISDTVNVPSGATITYTVLADVSASATGTLSNTANVAPGPGAIDVDLTNNTATDTDIIQHPADLAITKVDNKGGSSITPSTGIAIPGASITYTIVASNLGPSNVVGAAVTDTLPATLLTWTVTGTDGFSANGAAGGSFTDSTVNLADLASVTYTVTGTISPTATGTLSNTATVTPPADILDTNLANNTAVDTDTLVPTAGLRITKIDNHGGSSVTGAEGSILEGGAINTYTIVVTNMGPSTISGATISDNLAANAQLTGDTFTAVGTTGATGFSASGSGSISNNITLAPGSSITYTVLATLSATATGTLTNTAIIAPPAGVTLSAGSIVAASVTDTLTSGIA